MSARLEPPHTVGGAIARRARREPGKPALLGLDEPPVTFAELAAAIASARAALSAAGLARTDRVGVILAPGVAGARLLVSIACNVAAVPIDPARQPLEQLSAGARIRALARLGPEGALELETLLPARPAATMRPSSYLDVALLLHAGGGRRIALTHRDLREIAGAMAARHGVGRGDRAGCMLALDESGIEAALFAPLILGASVALGRRLEALAPTILCASSRQAVRGRTRDGVRLVLAGSELSLGGRPASAPLQAARSDDLMELELHALWKRLLGRDDIGLDEHFFVAGGDSLLATQMLLEVEALVGRAYPSADLSTLTIRHMAQVLRQDMPEERGCLTRVKSGSGTPLFFCHGDYQARGLYAHRLAALLPQEHPVYLLHPEREPPPGTTVETLAAGYLEEVLRVADGLPVLLAGFCNGGYVAWQLAHLLRARGVPVAGLILLDAPSFNARPVPRRLSGLLRFAGWRAHEQAMRALWGLYRHGAIGLARRAWRSARERLAGLATPAASWWLLVRSMATRYVPPPIDVDVYCVVAEEGLRHETDPRCWQRVAPPAGHAIVPGAHLSMVVAHRGALARAMARALREASARALSARRATPERSACRAAPAGQPG